jgi:hypothetical protein
LDRADRKEGKSMSLHLQTKLTKSSCCMVRISDDCSPDSTDLIHSDQFIPKAAILNALHQLEIQSKPFAMAQPSSTSAEPIEAPYSEAHKNRNPHPNFALVEASRDPYPKAKSWTYTKTPNPQW